MAVRHHEVGLWVCGARESETLVERQGGCVGDVNKQGAFGYAQRFRAFLPEHSDKLGADAAAALGRRNGQAAEVAAACA
jgi:hypothetical protein